MERENAAKHSFHSRTTTSCAKTQLIFWCFVIPIPSPPSNGVRSERLKAQTVQLEADVRQKEGALHSAAARQRRSEFKALEDISRATERARLLRIALNEGDKKIAALARRAENEETKVRGGMYDSGMTCKYPWGDVRERDTALGRMWKPYMSKLICGRRPGYYN